MLRLAEAPFVTIQGEGMYTGIPSLFVRLSGCNLRCSWERNGKVTRCDTPYSSWNPEYKGELSTTALKGMLGDLHLVITGGEPMLALDSVHHLLNDSGGDTPVTIETNGLLLAAPLPYQIMRSMLFSISPKINTQEFVKNGNTVEDYALTVSEGLRCHPQWQSQIKFVANDKSDFKLFDEFIDVMIAQAQRPDHICVMAQGDNEKDLLENELWVVAECIKRGWRFSDRLHMKLWKGERGR